MKIKIIVVDDNPLTNKLLARLIGKSFSSDEVEVEIFDDGKSGVDYLIEHVNEYHLVILDGHIKAKDGELQIDGPEIAKILESRLEAEHARKRLVIFSSDPDMVQKIREVKTFNDAPALSKTLSQRSLCQLLTEQFSLIEKDQIINETQSTQETVDTSLESKQQDQETSVVPSENPEPVAENNKTKVKKDNKFFQSADPETVALNQMDHEKSKTVSEKISKVETSPPAQSFSSR